MNKIVLYETCVERAELYRQVKYWYDKDTRTTGQDINNGVTSCTNYSKSLNEVIDFYCEGTTKKLVYHNGNGTIRIEEQLNSPDCGFTIPGGNPLPPDCDLTIVEAQTIKSNYGQSNGSVNILISGSGNIEYSLDGVNFSTGALKTNLAPGNYTAYARRNEQISCLASKAFTIGENEPIQVTVAKGCEGGLGFLTLDIQSPTTEGFIIDIVNQTTQELIHEDIPTGGNSYYKLYPNLTNGNWVATVKGTVNTLPRVSEPQLLECAANGNPTDGIPISEMPEATELNGLDWFPIVDISETDLALQNKKVKLQALREFVLLNLPELSLGIVNKDPVATFANLATTYPNAEEGWISPVLETINGEQWLYRFNGTQWLKYLKFSAGSSENNLFTATAQSHKSILLTWTKP